MDMIRRHGPTLDELMADAAKVAMQQDSKLAERSRQKRREQEQKLKEEQAARERAAREQAGRELETARESDTTKKTLTARKGQEEPSSRQTVRKQREEERRKAGVTPKVKGRTSEATTIKMKTKTTTTGPYSRPTAQQGEEKAAELSFRELMALASKNAASHVASTSTGSGPSKPTQPSTTVTSTPAAASAPPTPTNKMNDMNGRATVSGKRPPVPAPTHTRNVPSIYVQKRPAVTKKKTTSPESDKEISAHEKVRLLYQQPLTKLNTQKRDRRSVTEIQRDIRHSKGIYSSDEEDSRTDPRLMRRQKAPTPSADRPVARPIARPIAQPTARPAARPVQGSSARRPASLARPAPIPSSSQAPPRVPTGKQPMPFSSSHSARSAEPPIRRMPFSRPVERRPMKRPHEETDDDLDSFIVNDDEEPEDAPDYSAEISRIFRYNRNKYAEDIFSDDDMEADAREVLREEKRSERIGRREDLEEERRLEERAKRHKSKGKGRA